MTPDLPVDVWRAVGGFLRTEDLSAIVLANKYLNEIETPILYHTLVLRSPLTAALLVNTLNASPNTQSPIPHDLPCMVRHFDGGDAIRGSEWFRSTEGQAALAESLKMVNVRSVRLFRSLWIHLEAILATPHESLESVELHEHRTSIRNSDATTQTSLCFSLRQFVLIEMHVIPPAASELIKTAIYQSATSLRYVYLDTLKVANLCWDLDTSFPFLEHLSIKSSLLLDVSQRTPFRTLPRLRQLSIAEDVWELNAIQAALPSRTWPTVVVLTCPPDLLNYVLSHDARRPIHTYSTCRWDKRTPIDVDPGRWGASSLQHWHAFSLLACSSVPIKDLRLWDDGLHLAELRQLVQANTDMETLQLAVRWDYTGTPPSKGEISALGREVLAYAPKLRNLLLTVKSLAFTPEAEVNISADVDLQKKLLAEYETHSSALRRVSFMDEYDWEKRPDGQWQRTSPLMLD
ncbi:hypothetical protein C8Q76DRAFT_471589 [Earliella scabrosa]|nr:hypothetical protein C8Q76DRAFT_471589 [Earliella scabrosa]